MQEVQALKAELSALRGQIASLAAETLAVNWLLMSLMNRLCEAHPSIIPEVAQAFEDIASLGQDAGLQSGPIAAHVPKALHIVAEIRDVLLAKGTGPEQAAS